MTRKNLLIAGALLLASLGASADEGMWMLNQLAARTYEIMREMGLELTQRDLYNTNGPSLKDCVLDFGDYCSAVVVSPNGLVFTNHHCGYFSVQALSSTEDDLLDDGFVAHSYAEERPVDGLFVRFLERTVDCTTRVRRGMEGCAADKVDSVIQSVEDEYTEAYPDRYCLVKSYFGSSRFYASIYKVYNDVRLVAVPPQSLGKFGGDTDNWMWPRQTCDFSVFRVYADSLGDPAEYSPDNVPLSTARYAPVSLDGYEPGDFCMTVGYPGSTSRYLSSYGVALRVDGVNISMIDVRGKKQDVWKRWMDTDKGIALKYASKYASSSNYWKNSIGMNKAVRDLQVIEEKQKLEQVLADWCLEDSDRTQRFAEVLPALREAYKYVAEGVRAQGFFTETFKRGIEIFQAADILSSLPSEPDSLSIEEARERLRAFYKDYEPRVDEEVMAELLSLYRDSVPVEYLPAFYSTIDADFAGDCKAYAHDLYARTCLKDTLCLDLILQDTTLLSSDPALVYSRDISLLSADIAASQLEAKASIKENEDLLTQALLEMEQEEPHYSDANFSMRLSYGFVEDYTAEGTHYDFYTDSGSLLDKASKQEETEDYALEPEIVELLRKGDFGRYRDKNTSKLHLCFLSNNDITGGNSGSPMFNGKGELIGLAFDGNWEAMSGDISFNEDLQRCIGVDIRFVLFIVDKLLGADNIIRELGL
ncbi:MAG: S46 family peptidase [Prevotellaceae bacterium]|nr:S46 family peptidase [Prevotellaceae bacterium]